MTVEELIECLKECLEKCKNKDIEVFLSNGKKVFDIEAVRCIEHIDLLRDENCKQYICISIVKSKQE